MKIGDFQRYCSDDSIRITEHALLRCRQRKISVSDLENGIMNGSIIEEYPEDYPYPSALICYVSDGSPLHILIGAGEQQLWIITAYHPDPKKWNADYKKRKETV